MRRYRRLNYRGMNRRFGLFNFRWTWVSILLLIVVAGLLLNVLPILLFVFVLFMLFSSFGR